MYRKLQLNLIRVLLKCMYVIPINNKKIFFSSYEGKQYSCNPKYIFEQMREEMPEIRYVYEYNNAKKLPEKLNKGVVIVAHNSIRYFYELMTSKIIITNNGITGKVPIRKQQVQINTWHAGGSYKKVGKDITAEMNGSDEYLITLSEKQTTYYLSSCEQFSLNMESALGAKHEKMLPFGMPRNDLFFCADEKLIEIAEKVKAEFKLDTEKKIVLYAPTYRGNAHARTYFEENEIDIRRILYSLQKKFSGEWVFMYRGHYHANLEMNNGNAIDASNYSDMQELLIAAEVLITDYSSVVWDYSLMNKPAFLYTPDLEKYVGARNFYTPIEQWAYSYAKSNEELIKLINTYDASEQEKRNYEHHMLLNSYELGTATKQTVEFVKKLLNYKN